MRRLPFSAVLLCLAQHAAAQELSEALFLADLPQVLTASRIATSPLDAPAPVTVIDRETIRASGFTEIHDVLRLVPGFQVADWAVDGPMVAHHGLGTAYPRSLLVMLDGRSLVNPITGAVNWRELPVRLEDVERIEVVRAPSQASYGATAFNGVVNIITRLPGEDHGAALSFSLGERGYQDIGVLLARRGEALDWRLNVSTRESAPFEDRGLPHGWRRKISERHMLRLDSAYRVNLDDTLDFDLALLEGQDHLGSRQEPSEPYRQRIMNARYLQFVWQHTSSPGSEWALRYYHYRLQRDERYFVTRPAPILTLPIDQSFVIERNDLELQNTYTWSDALRGLWGVGLRQDEVRSEHFFFGLGRLRGGQWQIFGNLDWQLHPQVRLNLGTMVEKSYTTDTRLSPRLALNYAITPQQSLRLSTGWGYRAPTRLEADAYQVYTLSDGTPFRLGLISSETLQPERVDYIEAGYVGRHDDLGVVVDARVYEESYDHFILTKTCVMSTLPVLPPNEPCRVQRPVGYLMLIEPYKAFAFENRGGARVQGAELSLEWRSAGFGRLLLTHAYTHIAGKGDADPDSPHSAPRHSTSLLWSKPVHPRLKASLGVYRVGKMKWLGDGDWQPAYTRLDASLAWQLGGRSEADELAITLQNFGSRHFEFRTDSSAGHDDYSLRQAFVTLRLTW